MATKQPTNNRPPVKPGDRVELVFMPDEPAFGNWYHAGDRGTVTGVRFTEMIGWQVSVEWDNHGNLLLLHGVDQYRVIKEDKYRDLKADEHRAIKGD